MNIGRNGQGVGKKTWFQSSWDSKDLLWLGWPLRPLGSHVPPPLHSCSALMPPEQHMRRRFPRQIWSTVKTTHPTRSRAQGEGREGWLQLCTYHGHFLPLVPGIGLFLLAAFSWWVKVQPSFQTIQGNSEQMPPLSHGYIRNPGDEPPKLGSEVRWCEYSLICEIRCLPDQRVTLPTATIPTASLGFSVLKTKS